MAEIQIHTALPMVDPANNQGDQPPLSLETPTSKGKGRHRVLRGLQRISSSQSLKGIRRSKSVGSHPYKTRATLSCVSLAATGPPSASSSNGSTTPSTSPSGCTTRMTGETQAAEFPFYDSIGAHLAVRKAEEVANADGATIPLPADLIATKHDLLSKRSGSSQARAKQPFRLWDRMPRELAVLVLSHLEPKTLVQISRVSKSFYQSCFDGQLWTSFNASEFYQDIPAESLARIIVAAGPFIKTLNLRGCVQIEHYKRTEVIAKACKNLINATLEGCRNLQKNTLHSLLRSNEQLVHLNLTGLPAVTNSSCKIISECCNQLESFNVSWCSKVGANGIKLVVDRCPRLRDLRAGEVQGFNDLDVAESIFKRNSIEKLVLSGCMELDDQALKTMLHGVEPELDVLTELPMVPSRRLRHLDLSRCERLTDQGVKTIGHLAPDLEGIQLSGCKLLTDAALEPILATAPRLTHIDLEDLEDITNNLLSEHLAKSPCAGKLQHLSLSYCEKISDVGVLPIMQKCTSLASIDLDNTRISDLTLAEAAAMVHKRSKRSPTATRPKVSLHLVVYDCQNVTWTGIREVLFRNTQVRRMSRYPDEVAYPTEIIGLKAFYGFQMTVDEHQKRVLRGDLNSAGRLERKWADYMQATEEAGVVGAGHRRRRRRAREAQALHLDEEDGGIGAPGRRRARTLGSCAVM